MDVMGDEDVSLCQMFKEVQEEEDGEGDEDVEME